MKVRIKTQNRNLRLYLPTGLIFNRISARFADSVARKYAADAMENIPPQALEKLCIEFRRIKKCYGEWELVKVESSDGKKVEIIL